MNFKALFGSLGYLRNPGHRGVRFAADVLRKHGWKDRGDGAPFDAQGNPTAWYTYPALQYLAGLDLSDRTVFEYGAGNSSLWWAGLAKSVTSVEHDKQWYEKLKSKLKPNQTLLSASAKEDYVNACAGPYDIIVDDGSWRLPCAIRAVANLSPRGFIVLDNSDWFPKSAAALRDAGLIQVDFHGSGPINAYCWCTSIFLRPGVQLKPRGERQPVWGVGGIQKVEDEG